MAATVVDTSLKRTYGFYEVSLGKKIVMSVTGLILFGYVVGHLVGNLQVFLGREMINRYAEFLHRSGPLLWGARVVLLAAVGLHIWSSYSLWRLKRRARPVGYRKKADPGSNYASRTMLWSGPIIAAFVVFHVMHLTLGNVPGLALAETETGIDVYRNIVVGFRNPLVTGSYVVAIALLMLHLYHGVWSMFQSVGFSHPRYTPMLQRAAKLIAILLAIGYISIPLAVMAGVIGSEVQ